MPLLDENFWNSFSLFRMIWCYNVAYKNGRFYGMHMHLSIHLILLLLITILQNYTSCKLSASAWLQQYKLFGQRPQKHVYILLFWAKFSWIDFNCKTVWKMKEQSTYHILISMKIWGETWEWRSLCWHLRSLRSSNQPLLRPLLKGMILWPASDRLAKLTE